MKTQVDFSSIFNTALPKVYIRSVELQPASSPGPRNGVSYDKEGPEDLEKNRFGKKRPRENNPRFDDAGRFSKSLAVKVELTIKDRIKNNGNASWFDNETFLKHLKIKIVAAQDAEVIGNLESGKFEPRYIKRLKQKNKIIEKVIGIRKDNASILEQKRETIDGKSVYCVTYGVDFEVPNYRPKNLSIFASTFVDLREFYLHRSPGTTPSKKLIQGTVVSQSVIKAGSAPARSSVFLLPDGKLWAGPIHYNEESGYMAGAFHSSREHMILERKQVPNLVVKDYRVLRDVSRSDLLLRPYRKKRTKKLQNKRAQGNRIIKKDVYITEPDYSYNETNELRFLFHLDYHKLIAEKTQFGACFVNADPLAKEHILNNTKIKSLVVYRHRVEPGLRKRDLVLSQHEDRTEMVARAGDGRRKMLRPRRTKRSLNPALVDSEQVLIGGIKELDLGSRGSRGIRTFTVSDFDMASKTDGRYGYSVKFEIEDGTIAFVKEQKDKLSQAIKAFTEYYNIASRRENTNKKTGHLSQGFIEAMRLTYQVPGQDDVNTSTRRQRQEAVQESVSSAPWLNAIAVYTDVMRNLSNVEQSDIIGAAFLMQTLTAPTSGNLQGMEVVLRLLNKLENKISSIVHKGKKDIMMDEIDYSSRTSSYKGKIAKTSVKLNKRFKTFHDSNMQNFIGYDFLNLKKRQNLGLRTVTTNQLARRLQMENQKYFNENPFETDQEEKVDDKEAMGAKDFTRFIDLQDAYYSYLTPAKVRYGKRTLKLVARGRSLWKTKQYDVILSNLMTTTVPQDSLSAMGARTIRTPRESNFVRSLPAISYTTNYDASFTKISSDDLGVNIANSVVMSGIGAAITSPRTYELALKLEEASLGLEEDEASGIDPRDVMGENTKFATDKLETEAQELEPLDDEQKEDYSSVSNIFVKSSLFSQKDNLAIAKSRSASLYDPTNERNIVDRVLKRFDKTEQPNKNKQRVMSRMPNQIKSILIGADPQVNRDWFETLDQKGEDLTRSSRYTGLNYFNYCHINQLQVLVGFEQDKYGNPEILSPIYERLTKKIFDRVSDSGQPFVCRMRGYKFNDFKKSKKLKLPEYNEYFILTPRNQRRAPPLEDEDLELELEEEEEDLLPETDEEGLFVARLVEYSDLNSTGKKILRRLVRRNVLLANLMPEFTSTTQVQQPRTIARVGTNFAATDTPRPDRPRSQASSAVARRTRRQPSRTSTSTTMSRGPRSGGNY